MFYPTATLKLLKTSSWRVTFLHFSFWKSCKACFAVLSSFYPICICYTAFWQWLTDSRTFTEGNFSTSGNPPLFPENFTPRDAHCFWQWASKNGLSPTPIYGSINLEKKIMKPVLPNRNQIWKTEAEIKILFFLQQPDGDSSIALQLRGEVNISQLQGEIEFNTFLCDKPYNWCI